MTQASTYVPTPVTRPSSPQVTTVLVTRGVTEYLPRTVTAIAGQTRAPSCLVVVDASTDQDDDLTAFLAEPMLGAAVELPVSVVEAPRARTFGDGVRAALADRPGADDGAQWLWLLHDDSAPEPAALAELLRAVEMAPSVAIAGCKQQSWSDPVRVLEVGVATSRFGRRMTGIDEPEVDQGQHDGRDDVLGVGTAGALVRRDVWDALGGTDPALGPYGDGLDLSRRARLAGHRVVVVPRAVVRHAQASLARPVAGAVLNRPGWDARRSAQARREAYLHLQLAGVPGGLLPAVVVLAVLSGFVRALGRFLTKEPHLVLAELLAPWSVLARPARVTRARRTARATRSLSRRSLRPLQVTWRDVASQTRDRRMAATERRRTRQAPSELELREMAALRTRRRAGLSGVLVVGVVATVVALGPVLTEVMAGARLTGGSLAFGDAGLGETWSAATAGWVPSGLGSPGPVDPLLIALVPLVALVGSLGGAVAVLVLGAIVISATGAWFAAGAATRSVGLRAWATAAWVAAPALLVPLGEARFGAAVAHAALPWVVLGVARAVGVARIDVVESGLVGARRTQSARPDGAPDDVGDGPAPDGRVLSRTAEPSLAAAAGAGLALAVATAAAPVLLPFALLALLAVAALAPRRRRLVWVGGPALVLHAPAIADAAASWADGGWRALAADPGLPLASSPSPVWQQLLGWPEEPPAWVELPAGTGSVLPFVATGVVVLLAVLALAAPGRAARAVWAGWLAAACGLAAAVVAARVEVGIAHDADLGAVLVHAWPGSGLSLALAGLLTAALVGGAAFRTAMAAHRFGWRQLCAAVLTAAAVLGPLAVLGGWTWHVRSGNGLDIVPVGSPVVPAVGRQMQESETDITVLQVQVAADGLVTATLLDKDGRQLTEMSRSVNARAVTGAMGEARPVGPDDAETEVAQVAARLAAGTSGDVAEGLAVLGIGAVLVPPVGAEAVTDPGDRGGDDRSAGGGPSDGARSALVGRIDSTLGLERATETESGIIWRVAATDLGTTTSWARLLDTTAGVEGNLLAPVASRDGTVDTRIPAGTGQRLLVLAERADPGWRASLDGRPLRVVESQWRQVFELGPEGGRLTVSHAPGDRVPWLALQGLAVLVTILLALPVRRRRGVVR